jgi:hypothetical protein
MSYKGLTSFDRAVLNFKIFQLYFTKRNLKDKFHMQNDNLNQC